MNFFSGSTWPNYPNLRAQKLLWKTHFFKTIFKFMNYAQFTYFDNSYLIKEHQIHFKNF